MVPEEKTAKSRNKKNKIDIKFDFEEEEKIESAPEMLERFVKFHSKIYIFWSFFSTPHLQMVTF